MMNIYEIFIVSQKYKARKGKGGKSCHLRLKKLLF